jgi:hypothetical protein
MVDSIIKETIELDSVTADTDGNVFLTKRINLKTGARHMLLQMDVFQDAYMSVPDEPLRQNIEIVITPYPAIPTNMIYQFDAPRQTKRYPAAGDDSVLFKQRYDTFQNGILPSIQFPSPEIAAQNKSFFYSDHIYINLAIHGAPNQTYNNIAFSFMFVLQDKSVSVLEHTLGVLAESHNAMCALTMSNGHMNTISNLRGNTFPTWRFGGIRPEHTISPTAANSFFLEIDTRDAEEMVTTAAVRQVVADSRRMSGFDEAFGERRPEWLSMDLNQGIVAGAVRSDPIPLKYADNGNTRMF